MHPQSEEGDSRKQVRVEENSDQGTICFSPIVDFYAGTTLLVTGATGFLGKALLEKLLRCCPGIKTIYILVRPKKGVEVGSRHEQLFTQSVFDRLRAEKGPTIFNKVRSVAGDVSMTDLGLSEVDRRLLQSEVNIVIHSAASVRFNEGLEDAVNLNTIGTQRVMRICKGMANLKCLVHVSTAYSNADKREVREIVYNPPADPEAVIKLVKSLPKDAMPDLTSALMGKKHPNTYTVTKAMAEWIVQEEAGDIPCAIVRPSIVTAAWKDPVPGWVDNVTGITGLTMEAGRGSLRSILCNGKCVCDIIPVDIVVNTLIAVAWRTATHRSKSLQVYNCTTGGLNPVLYDKYVGMLMTEAVRSPTKYSQWYPGLQLNTNPVIHNFVEIFFQIVPAFIVDLFRQAKGKKPITLKYAKRLQSASKSVKYFANNNWDFEFSNMQALSEELDCDTDRKTFDVDVRQIEWKSYMNIFLAGIRTNILKEGPENLPGAITKINKLWCAHRIAQTLVLLVLAHLMFVAINFLSSVLFGTSR